MVWSIWKHFELEALLTSPSSSIKAARAVIACLIESKQIEINVFPVELDQPFAVKRALAYRDKARSSCPAQMRLENIKKFLHMCQHEPKWENEDHHSPFIM